MSLSLKFQGITHTQDFTTMWAEVASIEDTSVLSDTTHTATIPRTSTPTPTTSRIRSRVSTGASVASSGVVSYRIPSPAKKRKFMTDPIDEAIENAKKGK